MDFRTHVDIPPYPICSHSRRMMLVGSCFCEAIGRRLQENLFPAVVNPFGTVFNPQSIALVLRAALDAQVPELFLGQDGLWHSWLFGTGFSSPDADQARQQMADAVHAAHEALQHLDVLFLTLGTNRVSVLKQNGLAVTNCHKQPASCFDEQTLDVAQCTATLSDILERLFHLHSNLKVVVTVSPYRYAKYGYHQSQLAKATLLLAVDRLIKNDPAGRIAYFPAYEIVLDELRDYRFYDADMLHPSEQAADYIFERLLAEWTEPRSQEFVREWQPLQRFLHHRPLRPDTPAWQEARARFADRCADLQRRYPEITLPQL